MINITMQIRIDAFDTSRNDDDVNVHEHVIACLRKSFNDVDVVTFDDDTITLTMTRDTT